LSKTRCTTKKNLENVHLEPTAETFGFYGIKEFSKVIKVLFHWILQVQDILFVVILLLQDTDNCYIRDHKESEKGNNIVVDAMLLLDEHSLNIVAVQYHLRLIKTIQKFYK